MSYLKKFGLIVSAVAFCLSLYVASADAQWRQDRSREYRERTIYGDRSRSTWNRRYNRNRSIYWGQQSRYRRVTPQEYRRLQRQRSRIYRNTYRYYNNDGYLNNRERRKLYRQQYKYRRNVYRDRRDW